MWISNATRPDISNAVREVARHAHDPSEKHWRAVLRIIEYLRGTRDKGIVYKRSPACRLVAYADSSFAENKQDRRSVSGGVVLLARGAISWFSRRQHCVTLSTTESEYVALSDVAREVVLLRGLVDFLMPGQQRGVVTVLEDNDGAVKLASNPICTNRMKRIDVRCHFVREKVDRKIVKVVYVSSADQTTAGLTKNLPVEALVKHRWTLLNE